jgi:methionyl-tRNA formyltransferase
MRILFIGCVDYSKKILEHLIDHRFEIVGIITKDDTGFNADYSDISLIASVKNIPFIKTKNVNEEEVLAWVRMLQPETVYCFGWNSFLGKEFLQIPSKGVIGYHPAALPQNRGRHPIIWALVLGLKQTASTFFFMGEGADDGDIVSQKFIEVHFEDNAKTLYERLVEVSKLQVIEFSMLLKENRLNVRKQEHSQSNLWRKRSKIDGRIDFRMASESIYYLIRGLTNPYPGATVEVNGTEHTIWKASISTTVHENFEPGKILKNDKGKLLIKCGLRNEAILLEEHDLPDSLEVGTYLQ